MKLVDAYDLLSASGQKSQGDAEVISKAKFQYPHSHQLIEREIRVPYVVFELLIDIAKAVGNCLSFMTRAVQSLDLSPSEVLSRSPVLIDARRDQQVLGSFSQLPQTNKHCRF